MLTLYGNLDSGNVYKVRLLLAQLGIPHRRVDVSQLTADTARPEFRAINPIGKVPTLVFNDGRMLSESGAIVIKFWLAISKDEQYRRFRERQQTAFKRFKITPEDWRNRKKWEAYEQAVCDMVDRTSTAAVAPWTLVEANDKLYARIKVLKTICERLESALKR